MTKRKKKHIPVVPAITSGEEAEQAATDWFTNSPSDDPYDGVEASDNQMNKLRALVRKIWEDAYAAGQFDARTDAAAFVTVAEWFNG